MTHHHTHESTRQALAHIPANLPRDEWARVGMAIKSEFPDDGGFDLFSEWSASVPGFKVNECRAAWKSFKAGGSVTMGSLIHLAKQHGYTVPKDGQAAANLRPKCWPNVNAIRPKHRPAKPKPSASDMKRRRLLLRWHGRRAPIKANPLTWCEKA